MNDKGQRVSVETGNVVEWVKEENYKFALSKFQDRVAEWLQNGTGTGTENGAGIEEIVKGKSGGTALGTLFPPSKRSFVLNMVRDEMQDLSISRLTSKVRWGIPVPNDPEHTIYVWLDALTNYLTVTGYPWQEEAGAIGNIHHNSAWPADFHIVGKDIVKFHAIYWPAFLMAAGLPPPSCVVAHGHWLTGGEKMSKSRGNVVDPFEAIDKFGSDSLRYYLLRYGSFVDDGGRWIDDGF